MALKIITALFRPEEFFGELSKEEAAFAVPFGIVIIYSILSAVAGYQMAALMAPMYDVALEGYGGVIAIFGAIGGFVGGIMVWIVAAVLFYLVSMAFHGEGSMKKVLEAVGYGMAPLIAAAGIGIAYLAMVADQVVAPVIRDIMDTTVAEEAVEAFMNQPVMADFTLLQTFLSVVFMIWAANIWYYGIRHARKLKARDAGITVIIPVVLYLIIVIASYGVF
ncbi:YIP1 family protein [Methanocalculus sp.]|uniref:YIP1 family protein n=1 Tax=Methanocalculus sp. TaxID=2004547 RepID=UPI002624DEF1|nr:YIP1 family protein [Methanocalculus sp.]MDG6249807.1 YIP1 family protein [Methanocalculus sp.]